MKRNLLKITSIIVLVAIILNVFATLSNATEAPTFELDKEYIEVQAGRTASFTISSNDSQEFYIVSENEDVCTIFDPQGATVLTSEFKLEGSTKTFAVSGTAPGETVVKVNAGYVGNEDGTGSYQTTKEIRVRVTQATTVTNDDIPYTGTEDIILVVGLLMVVIAVIYIKFEKLNKDMK